MNNKLFSESENLNNKQRTVLNTTGKKTNILKFITIYSELIIYKKKRVLLQIDDTLCTN